MTAARQATPARRWTGPLLLVGGYLLPVAGAVALLALIGDRVLALALALVELAVSAAVAWAVHPRPGRQQRVAGGPVLGTPGAPVPHRGPGRSGLLVAAGVLAAIGVPALIGVLSVRR